MKKINGPKTGAITNPMDAGTDGFQEFQALVARKSETRSDREKRETVLLSLSIMMEDYIESKSDHDVTAGEFLKLHLKLLNIRQKKFAEYIKINPANLSKIISGERQINYEFASILGNIFNQDPMLWIRIQAKNELNKVRKTKHNNYKLSDLVDF